MSREEEYLRRMKALGYEPSLAGMDDEDIEWELNRMDEAGRRQATQPQPVRTVYRPVDQGLQARILRMFGRPYDKSAIPRGQEYYLNGWDDGEEEDVLPFRPWQRDRGREPFINLPDYPSPQEVDGEPFINLPAYPGPEDVPAEKFITPLADSRADGGEEQGGAFDPWAKAWRPDWGPGGNPLRTMEDRPARGGTMLPSRGDAIRPLSYTAGGNDVNTGGQGTDTAGANRYAGGYANGGAEGDMLFGVTGVTPLQPKQYVSADQLKAFGWQNVDDGMVRDLNNALGKYDITTPARIRHFLSQAAKESDMGRSTLEYGDDDYWNGNGYGRKYRGAGYIQMTWPDVYEKFAKEVSDKDVVTIGAEHVAKKYPWQASAYWWHKLNQMNDLVDNFDDADTDADVERVTRRVNGVPDWSNPEKVKEWRKSLRERQEHYKRSREIFRD